MHPCKLILALVTLFVVTPFSPASAANLTQDEWNLVYKDIGNTVFLPFAGAHYSTKWQFSTIGLEYRYIDLRKNNAHWNSYLNKSPRGFSSIGGAGWVKLARRIRVGGGFRHDPLLNIAVGTLALSAQLLRGTSDKASFFIGLAGSYMQNPDIKFVAPHAFIEWSNELGRTKGNQEKGPWIFYLAARVDQGYRFVFNKDPVVSRHNDLMDIYIRGGIRLRHRNIQVGYDFGGQQKRTFSHGLLAAYTFSRNLSRNDSGEKIDLR